MKSKKLMIIVLVLAIVTALSAGTLAVYTTTIDKQAVTEVKAKAFGLAPGVKFTETIAVSVAPGGREYTTAGYELHGQDKNGVANEVDTTLTITPTFDPNFFKDFPGMQVNLCAEGANKEKVVIHSWSEQNLASYELPQAFKAGNAGRLFYTTEVVWNDTGDSKTQTQSAGRTWKMKLTFTGTQYIAAQ